MALTWDTIYSSPEYQQAVQQIRAGALRQGRALPEAQPQMREALTQQAAQQIRSTDVAERLGFAQQEQDLHQRGLALKERAFQREQARQPWATGISLAGVGVDALRGYGTLRAGRRAEAETRRLQDIGLQTARAQQESSRTLTNLARQQAEYLRQSRERLFPPEL